MIDQDRLINEFIELVQVNSVSGYERQLCDLLKKKLASLGLEVSEDNAGGVLPSATGNITARLSVTKKAPHLLFCAHMDTVEPGRGIKPSIDQDGVIQSNGETVLGADDKAGVAAIMEAIRIIQNEGIRHGGITVVFTVREETGLIGAKGLDPSINADYGFVLDATGPPGAIVVRAPSQDRITTTVHGRTAHAGVNPEAGINAIYVAAQSISAMPLGRIDHETTANIGIICGGKAVNIVPDNVYLEGEVRSLQSAKRAKYTARIRKTIEETARKAGARADVNVELLYEGFDLPENAPVVQLGKQAVIRCGLEPSITHSGGGSDANILNARGIPTINLATGMENVHTTREQITVNDIINLTRLVLEIIQLA
ncbi:MAG: M20/M25/M40 family metallo-hydrolase [Bacillota bacterium]